MPVNLAQFRPVESWLLVGPKRRCSFNDSTCFFDRKEKKWFTTVNGFTFRSRADEIFFRLELNDEDVANETKCFVPNNKFFLDRHDEFFVRYSVYSNVEDMRKVKDAKNFNEVLRDGSK